MAVTFSQLKAKLADWQAVNSTSRLSESVRGDCINAALSEILRDNDLKFGEVSGSAALASGSTAWTLPTGLLRLVKLEYVDAAGDYQPIQQAASIGDFRTDWPRPLAAGTPAEYLVWGTTSVLLNVTTDAALTLHYDGYQTLPDLSADDDSNAFTNNCWQPIVFYAAWWASTYLIEDGRTELWRANYERWLAVLNREHAISRNSGRAPQMRIFGGR